MTYKILKIGSDAELFVTKEGNPFPICGVVGGTKEEPIPVLGGNGFAVQEDNVLLEFNIPPASSATEFATSINTMLDYLRQEMSKKGLEVKACSSLRFPMEQLESEQAKTFGCMPDFCVWTKSVNKPPSPRNLQVHDLQRREAVLLGEIRSSGYHIHVSYEVDGDEPGLADREAFVKAQDLFVGVPSIFVDESAGSRHNRRSIYGRAGCFRPKPYGHEYRVLGGHLLGQPPEIHNWIFEQTQRACDFLNNNELAHKHLDANTQAIQHVINNSDFGMAMTLFSAFQLTYPPMRADTPKPEPKKRYPPGSFEAELGALQAYTATVTLSNS